MSLTHLSVCGFYKNNILQSSENQSSENFITWNQLQTWNSKHRRKKIVSVRFRKAGRVWCGDARETHWATCHNGVSPSKTKEFLESPCFMDRNSRKNCRFIGRIQNFQKTFLKFSKSNDSFQRIIFNRSDDCRHWHA